MNLVTKRTSQNIGDRIKVARSKWRAKNYTEAQELLSGMLKEFGPSMRVSLALADLEAAQRNLPGVVDNLNAAIAAAKPAQKAPIQKRLAYVLRRQGDREGSRKVLADAGLIDRPTFVRTFPSKIGDIGLEIYPIRVNGEPAEFIDHHADLDMLLVKSDRAVFWSRDGGLIWHEFPNAKPRHITNGFVVSDKRILLYDSERGVLQLHDDQGPVLASHSAPVPWHGSWGIGQAGNTIIYAEYDLHQRYRGREKPVRRVYRSADGGLTWTPVHEVAVGGVGIRHFHTVQPDPYAPNTWYLSSGDKAEHCRVWRSTDDGQTWSEVTDRKASDQRLYRFTALHFSKDAIYWGTDDQLGVGKAQAVKAERGQALKLQTLGSLGPEKCRVIIETPFGLVTISQAKDEGTKTHISLIDEHGGITSTDPIESPKASGVTFSCASRRSVHGRFFTRGANGSLGDQTETYLWKVNHKALLQASDKCNVCSEVLAAELGHPGGEVVLADNLDAKLWQAFHLNTYEIACPSCLNRARTRTFAAVYRQFLKTEKSGGPAITVSAAGNEYRTVSRNFSPVQNVSLYRGDQYINCLSDVDITSMPQIGSGEYNFAFAMNVLDYIEKIGDAFREMWRVLRPGGAFMFFIMPYRMVEGDAPPQVLHRNAMASTDKYGRNADGSTGIPTCIFSTGWIAKDLKAAGFEAEMVRIKDPFSEVRHIWWICRKP